MSKKPKLSLLSRLFVTCNISVLLASSLLAVGLGALPAKPAEAASSVIGNWINASQIDINSAVYIDGKLDSGLTYWKDGKQKSDNPATVADCSAEITAISANHDSGKLYTFTFNRSGNGNTCLPDKGTIVTLIEPQLSYVQYLIQDSAHITTIDNGKQFVATDSSSGVYFQDSGCKPAEIHLDPKEVPDPGFHTISGKLYTYSTSTQDTGAAVHCAKDGGTDIVIGNASNITKAPPGQDNGQGNQPTCEGTAGPLGWLICGVINFVSDTVQGIGKFISDQLQVNILTSDKSTNGQTARAQIFVAWQSLRDLADALLIIVFLIIIFGQTLGVEAYTVKKSLPRIVAAAILIQLSFIISGFMIDVFNILGANIDKLISLSTGKGWHLSALVSTGATVGGVAGIIVLVGAVASGAALLAAIAALIAVVGVFLTIAFRKIAIILLIITAPLALLAWVLPNTEKFFKMWWTNFTKILLMYPLMVAIFAISNFAYGINSSTNTDPWSQLISVFIMIAPLFAIPFVFKAGGQLMNLGAGVVSNVTGRASKAVGPQSQLGKDFKAARQESRALQAKNGTIFGRQPKSKVGQAVGRGFGRIGLGAGAANIGRQAARKRGALYGAAVSAREKDFTAALEGLGFDDVEARAQAANDVYVKSRGTKGVEELRASIAKLGTMGAGGRKAIAGLARTAAAGGLSTESWMKAVGSTASELGPKAPDAMNLDDASGFFKAKMKDGVPVLDAAGHQAFEGIFSGAGAGSLRQLDAGTMQRLLVEMQKAVDSGGSSIDYLHATGLQDSEILALGTNPNNRPEDAYVARSFDTISTILGTGGGMGTGGITTDELDEIVEKART